MLRHHVQLAAVSALLVSTAPQLRAQASSPPPLTKVRLVDVTSGRPLVTGALTGHVGDTLFIMPDGTEGTPQRYALASSHRLERSIGMQRSTLQGLGSGLLLGAMAGALIGVATYESCEESDGPCLDFGRGLSVAAGAVFLALPSAIIGAIAGYNTLREGWVPANEDRTRLTVAPLSRGGLRIGAAVTF